MESKSPRVEVINLTIFFTLSAIIIYLVVQKALQIPITHDETSTTVHYSNYGIWQIMMYPDQWPNNHILNTLFTKFFISILGKEQWVVRLPNLLFLFVYCFGVYRIISTLFTFRSAFFIVAFSLFFTNPYLLDFFSLCRGYGMGVAIETLSASFVISGFLKKDNRHIWVAFFLALISSYANFTLLIYWSAITCLAAIFFLKNYQKQLKNTIIQLSGLVFFSVVYFLLILTPLRKMTSTDQFDYWSSDGMIRDTLFSLVENCIYGANLPFGLNTQIISYLILTSIILTGMVVLYRFWKEGFNYNACKKPMSVAFLILGFVVSVSLIQCIILDTPNLSGRTALFLYPLFSLLLVSLLSEWQQRKKHSYFNFVVLIIPILAFWHFTRAYNPHNVREWWYDESTLEVLEFLETSKYSEHEEVSLDVHWMFHRSFFFYTYTDEIPWLNLFPYDKQLDPDRNADYYYVFDSNLELYDSRFEKVKKFGWDRWLLKKVDFE